jgi:hypothetical protein
MGTSRSEWKPAAIEIRGASAIRSGQRVVILMVVEQVTPCAPAIPRQHPTNEAHPAEAAYCILKNCCAWRMAFVYGLTAPTASV